MNNYVAKLLGGVFLISGILWFTAGPQPDEFNIFYMAGGSAFLLGALLLLGAKTTTFAVNFSRIFVGALFIVSGMIKANDTMGFGFKLEEYFDENSLGAFWAMFHDWSFVLALVIASTEVMLGFAVLFGTAFRMASWLILGMIVFFSWLTSFTATCNDEQLAFADYSAFVTEGDIALLDQNFEEAKIQFEKAKEVLLSDEIAGRLNHTETLLSGQFQVQSGDPSAYFMKGSDTVWIAENESFDRICVTDCGCFGDALKDSVGRSLTPWESFYKDITLLFFTLILFFVQGKIKRNEKLEDLIILPASILLVAFFGGGLFGWWFPTWFTIVACVGFVAIKAMPWNGRAKQFGIIAFVGVLCFGFSLYTKTYLPIKDYRPYKVGNSIYEQMNNGVDGTFKTLLTYKHKSSGETMTFEMGKKEFPSAEEWEWINTENQPIIKAVAPSIQDLRLSMPYDRLGTDHLKLESVVQDVETQYYEGYSEPYVELQNENTGQKYATSAEQYSQDSASYSAEWKFQKRFDSVIEPPNNPCCINVTDYVLTRDKIIWIVAYDLLKTNYLGLTKMSDFAEQARKDGYETALLSCISLDEVKELLAEQNIPINFDFYVNDPIELKIVVRDNPGLVYLEKDKILAKWSSAGLPTYDEFTQQMK